MTMLATQFARIRRTTMKPKPLYSTPTSAMIEALSTMGMTMKEAAGFVLADNGSIPRAYADDLSHRSTLTKRFKQARPGSLTSNDFDDFTVSVPRLLRELLSQRHVAPPEGGARSAQVAGGLLDQLIGEPAQAMERVLQNYSLAPDVFASALDDALAAPLPPRLIRRNLRMSQRVAVYFDSFSKQERVEPSSHLSQPPQRLQQPLLRPRCQPL